MNANDRKAAVLDAIKELRVSYGFAAVDPLVMLAQSALETGYWESNLCAQFNNAFGMHQNSRDIATGVTQGDGGALIATYDNLRDSVRDYLARQQQFHVLNTTSPVDYINSTVNSGYAAGTSYASSWAKIASQFIGDAVGTGDDVVASDDGGSGYETKGAIGPLLILGALLFAMSR